MVDLNSIKVPQIIVSLCFPTGFVVNSSLCLSEMPSEYDHKPLFSGFIFHLSSTYLFTLAKLDKYYFFPSSAYSQVCLFSWNVLSSYPFFCELSVDLFFVSRTFSSINSLIFINNCFVIWIVVESFSFPTCEMRIIPFSYLLDLSLD